MAIKKKYDSDAGDLDPLKLSSNEFSDNVSKLLDNYEIEVLDAHLEQCIKKNSKLLKKNKKLKDDLELMTQCFVEMVEKNYRLEDEIKKYSKKCSYLSTDV